MIKGNITALITPFLENMDIDYESLRNLINLQLDNKVNGLLLLGTTAEAEALSNDEKKKLVSFVCDYVKSRTLIMVGLISNVTKEVVEASRLYKGLPIDSYLVINPYYNKTNISGMIKHFIYIADHVDHPIVLYNVPKRTNMAIPFEVIEALSYHHNIIGIKDASGDIELQERIKMLDSEFLYYCGDDSIMYASSMLGCDGVISVIGNIFPKDVGEVVIERKIESFKKLYCLISTMYDEVSPIGIKYILYCFGLIKLNYRLPLVEPSFGLKRRLEDQISKKID